MRREVDRRFLPCAVFAGHPTGEEAAAARELISYLESQPARDGKATAYVCEGYACKEPVGTAAQLATLLDE